MNKIFALWGIMAFLTVAVPVNAQNVGYIVIAGRVTDEYSEPVPGASVYVRGNMKKGTSTDDNGYYYLEIPDGKDIFIEAAFIGMKTKAVAFTGQKEINIQLEIDSILMEGAIVTGKQNINDVDIRAKAGVVSVVDVKRLQDKPVVDMSVALQGVSPGLVVINKGDLGTKPEIRIRGNASFRQGDAANEPLYVLDGQVISSDAFMTLNPLDIADIKVLKDAAACALYGTKASNGVIEITSVRGTNGETLVTYNFSGGITTRGRRGVRMMETDEKLELERRLRNPAAPGYRYSEEYIREKNAGASDIEELVAQGQAILDELRKTNTDWFKELLRNDFYQRHNFSVRGGNNKTSYYASANYSYQGGQIPGNDINRLTGRLSLDQAIGKIGFMSVSVDAGYSKSNSPNSSEFSPSSLIYDLNPYESKTSGELWSYPNRTYDDLFYQFERTSSEKRFGTSASINLQPLEGLTVDGVAGLDMVLSETRDFTPASSWSEQRSGASELERGRLARSKDVISNITTNVRVTWNRTFGKHDITLGANTDYYLSNVDNMGITGYGVGMINSPSAINQSIEGNRKVSTSNFLEKTAQVGAGVLGGYNYNDTYDVFATYKADASSILPRDKRWNAAWAVGAGWNIKSYFKDWEPVSSLRVKASYGNTASLAGISPSLAVATFQYSENSYGDRRLLELMSLYNDMLKPEHTISTEAGLDLGLWDICSLGVGFYDRVTQDALLDVPIPASNGFVLMKRNIGSLSNSGVEASVSVKVLRMDEIRMTLHYSIAYNMNRVLDLYDGDRLYTDESSLVPDFEVGQAYDIVWGPISNGIDPMTGYPTFRGHDGREIPADGKLTREDMVPLGHSVPPFSGTFNISFTYRNLEFDADFYYVAGGIKAYAYSYVRDVDDPNKNAVRGQVENMWFKPGDENKIYNTPFVKTAALENLTLYANSRSIGSSDYLRLSMLSLRYRVPHKWFVAMGNFFKYGNVAFQASNLFTITRYKESDPESGSFIGAQQPVFTLNLSLSF